MAKGEGVLALWDLTKDQAIREFKLPAPKGWAPTSLAISAAGERVAASATGPDNQAALTVWDLAAEKPLHEFKHKATALAFSPDGSVLGGGNENGLVTLWDLKTGKRTDLPGARHNEVHVVAFGRNPWRGGPPESNNGWLLAAGDAGGTVIVWDVGRAAIRSFCLGSYHDVYALAFHPDGMTLASAGRGSARHYGT